MIQIYYFSNEYQYSIVIKVELLKEKINMRRVYKSTKTASGRQFITPYEAVYNVESDLQRIKATEKKAKRKKYLEKHPTENYGPLLKTIKNSILEYEKYRNGLIGHIAMWLDIEEKRGFTQEGARNRIIKGDIQLPSSIKSWAEQNGLDHEGAIRLLLGKEFDFIRYYILKSGLEIEDEDLILRINIVKKDLEIEKANSKENESYHGNR